MSKKVVIDKETVEQLYQNHNTKECGKILGISQPTFCRLLYDYEIPVYTQKIDIDYDKMIAEYKSGVSIDDLAERFDVSRTYILTKLKRFGVDTSANYSHVIKTGSGYIMEYKPNHPYCDSKGYVRQHRLVMEQHIGRYLEPCEVVHHINEDKADNRIENLHLCSNSEHRKAHTGAIHKAINIEELENCANEYTLAELAEIFDTTVDTIKSRLARYNINRTKRYNNQHNYRNNKI